MTSIDSNGENGVLVETGYGNTISINDIDGNGVNGIYLKSSQGNRLDQNGVCNNGEYDIKQSAQSSSGDDNQCENVDNWDDEDEDGCTTSCGAAPAEKIMFSRTSSESTTTAMPSGAPVGFAISPPSTGGIPLLGLLGILSGFFAVYLIIKFRNKS